jgi:hypothetical protein
LERRRISGIAEPVPKIFKMFEGSGREVTYQD